VRSSAALRLLPQFSSVDYASGPGERGPASPFAIGQVIPPRHAELGVRRVHNLETRVSQSHQNDRGCRFRIKDLGRKVGASEQIG
jgi:hypothetical protein